MQVIDNLIVVHNFNEKSTNMYDIKLAEYTIPICVDNLDVDTQYFLNKYHSDILFKEEENSELKSDATGGESFKSPSDLAHGKEDKIKESKEYFEINF